MNEKLDRELGELLQELRVALPGIQVLFAFLLTVPFSQRFAQVTSPQKGAYFLAFLCAATATAFFIAPTAYHRVQWREHDKEFLLRAGNISALIGTVFLAVAVVSAIFVITDLLFGGAVSTLVTIAAGVLFAMLWYALPLTRKMLR
ncbi:MAG: DUF6328 family protein [Actinomycetota bacterium]